MSLFDVKHQGEAQQEIQRAIRRGRLAHAYIFHGPDGVGKELFARGLAELLLCDAPRTAEPPDPDAVGVATGRIGCGTCADCRAVARREAGVHPDLHIVHRHLNREHPDATIRKRTGLDLSIDVVRHFLIAPSQLTSIRGRAKVFIVRDAETLTRAAQNALLKTLEEPPDATVVVLLTTAVDRLLDTTRSRCQMVRFDALPLDFLENAIAHGHPDLPPDHVAWYARASDGSLGAARNLIEADIYSTNRSIVEDLVRMSDDRAAATPQDWMKTAKALGAGHKKRDPDISDAEAVRRGVLLMFRLAAMWYADVLRADNNHDAGVVNAAHRDALRPAAARFGSRRAADAIQRIVQAEGHLRYNVHTQLCVETLLNGLARIATDRTSTGRPLAPRT
ncbi:MAG: ATP-binding protein [Phycisphaerae bacterium]